MSKVANEWVREQFRRYNSGACSDDHKRMIRSELIQRFSDELTMTAAHWLRVQRANTIACWPYQPRTRAWNPLHCHKAAPIPGGAA